MKPLPSLEIIDQDIDERTTVDINPLRGLEDPRLFHELDKWFARNITVDHTIEQSYNFFQILLGHASLGWLRDKVSIGKYYFLKFSILSYVLNHNNYFARQHIHEYFRLIGEN